LFWLLSKQQTTQQANFATWKLRDMSIYFRQNITFFRAVNSDDNFSNYTLTALQSLFEQQNKPWDRFLPHVPNKLMLPEYCQTLSGKVFCL